MSREYVIATPLGPRFISENGSRTENISGTFLTETVSTVAAAKTPFTTWPQLAPMLAQ